MESMSVPGTDIKDTLFGWKMLHRQAFSSVLLLLTAPSATPPTSQQDGLS